MPTDATFCSNYLTTAAQIMQSGKPAVFISTENVLGECNMTMTANQTLYCTMIKVKEVRENSLHTRRQQQSKPKLFNQIDNKPEHCLHYLLATHCKRTVCHWSSPICQQTAAHICKDQQIQKLFYLLFFNSLQCE